MNLEFDQKIIHLKVVESTNDFANEYIDKNDKLDSFVITARFSEIWKRTGK